MNRDPQARSTAAVEPVPPPLEWALGLAGAAALAAVASRSAAAALLGAVAPLAVWVVARWPLVPVWLLTIEMVLGGWGHLIDIRGLPIRHVLLGLVLASWAGQRLARGDWSLYGRRHLAAVSVFLAFIFVAVLVSVVAGNPAAVSDGATPFFLLLVLPFLDIARGPSGPLVLLRSFVAAVGLLAVVQIALSAGIATGRIDGNWLAIVFDQRLGGVVQLAGPFWRVFIVGSIYYQVAILMLAAGMVARQPLFGRRRDTALLVILVLSLLLTFTRGYWASAIIGGGVLVVTTSAHGRVRMLVAALAASLLLVAMIAITDSAFVDVLWQRVLQTFSPDRDISVALRLDLYPRLMARIAERPWLGYGFGVLVENQLYYENSYLYYAIKVGLIGTLVVLAPWLMLVVTALQVTRRGPPRARAIAAGLTAAIVSMLAVTAINPFINSAPGLYFQALTTAVVVAVADWGRNAERPG